MPTKNNQSHKVIKVILTLPQARFQASFDGVNFTPQYSYSMKPIFLYVKQCSQGCNQETRRDAVNFEGPKV